MTAANRFQAWVAAGFPASSILSVTPPGCPLAETSEIRPDDRGKAPGRRNRVGSWGGYDWRAYAASAADLDAWDAARANIGLKTEWWPALDCDVDEPELAAAIARLAAEVLGAAPARGRAGSARWLRLYRWAWPGAKMSLAWRRGAAGGTPAALEKVELLGDGQQCVVQGLHPSGTSLRWDRRPRPAELVEIDADAIARFFDQLAALVEIYGGEALVHEAGAVGDRREIRARPEGVPAALRAEMAAVASAIPCEDLDYHAWVKHLAAWKAWSGGDETIYAEIVEEWSGRYGDNTPEATRKRWDSFSAVSVGGDFLVSSARAGGYAGPGTALVDFPPLSAAELAAAEGARVAAVAPDLVPEVPASWILRYVYVLAVERYVDLETMQMLSETAFKRLYSAYGHPSDSRNNAAMIWQLHAEARKVASLTYRPGEARFVIDEGRECLNVWQACSLQLPEVATDADISPWLAHAAYLLPDAAERSMVLDWAAYRLQRLDRKVNFALCFGGDEGIGKNLLMSVLHGGLGVANVKGIDQADVEGQWSDWAGNCVLVVIEELHHFGEFGVNKIKKYITVPPTRVRINTKNIAQYEVPNTAAILAYTNHRDALRLDRGDRRWLVVWSGARPREAVYYSALAGWLEGGGDAAVVRWLLSRDLSAFDAQGRAPMTAAKQEMRELAAHPVEAWVRMAIEEAIPPFAADLVRVDSVVEALPRHLAVHKPTLKRVAAGIRAAGGEALGQFRLGWRKGMAEVGAERIVIWAIREGARYAAMTREDVVEAFWLQTDPPMTQAGLDLIESLRNPGKAH